ncbi:hypothetical protein PG993_000770 [Apiospora rasikravindrae]|uniref:Uncharacterized protein n=1 Tax=Apiospora rasikravindrae TaxID=990691 RepID=A0ABR1U9J1_9PEZI
MSGYNTCYKKRPSTRSSRHTVQEDKFTRHRPPHLIQKNVPSGQTAGSPNEPTDELAQELESMAMSGKGESARPIGSARASTSTSNRTTSGRPGIARYALMQPHDPAKYSLTSETLDVFNHEQGGHEHYPNFSNWCSGTYNPGNQSYAIADAAADPGYSMYATRPARSHATDASWTFVSAPDEKQDRISENINGAGALFYDTPTEPTWNEYDMMYDIVYEPNP